MSGNTHWLGWNVKLLTTTAFSFTRWYILTSLTSLNVSTCYLRNVEQGPSRHVIVLWFERKHLTQKCVTNRCPAQNFMLCLDCRDGPLIAQQKISELKILPISPVLHDFPPICIHESVDVYVIFCLEPLNCLSFVLSKLLKECPSNRLFNINKS